MSPCEKSCKTKYDIRRNKFMDYIITHESEVNASNSNGKLCIENKIN